MIVSRYLFTFAATRFPREEEEEEEKCFFEAARFFCQRERHVWNTKTAQIVNVLEPLLRMDRKWRLRRTKEKMYPTRRIRHYSLDQTQQQAAVPWSGMISSCPDTIVSVSVSVSLSLSASPLLSLNQSWVGVSWSLITYTKKICARSLLPHDEKIKKSSCAQNVPNASDALRDCMTALYRCIASAEVATPKSLWSGWDSRAGFRN